MRIETNRLILRGYTEASCRTAVANGMRKVKEYPDEKNDISYAYAITRSESEEIRREYHADY